MIITEKKELKGNDKMLLLLLGEEHNRIYWQKLYDRGEE